MAPGVQYFVTALCQLTGAEEAETQFVVFQGICLILAVLYRHFLSPNKVTATTRHVVTTVLGLYIGICSFSWSICHLFLQSTVAYVLMKVMDPTRRMPQVVFVFTMGYLCVIQLRKALDNDLTSADYSTSMMIITMRITDLAYSIHDGSKEKSKVYPKHNELAIRHFPTPLEYYSYIFHFQGILIGPFCYYKDYVNYIEGKDLLLHTKEDQFGKRTVANEPSALVAVLGKLACSIGMMVLVAVAGPKFPVLENASDEIVNSSLLYRIAYLLVSLKLCEMRYVLAWVLVDAICNASGLGFNGYHPNGKPKWDLVTNVHYHKYVTAVNFKQNIDSWNIGTARWLKHVCYDRVPFLKEVLTFLLSAVWHGFFFSYYWCVTTLAPLVLASRKLRRNVRPHFLQSSQSKERYDWLTRFVTVFSTPYFTVSFQLYTFHRIIKFYSGFYFIGHIIVLMILLLPNRKSMQKREPNSNEPNYVMNGLQQTEDERETSKKDL